MLIQHAEDILVKAHGGHKEFLTVKGLHRKGRFPAIVLRRQDGQQLVIPQKCPLQRGVLAAGKAHIHPILQHPAIDLVYAAHLDVHSDIRVLPAKLLDDLRQPMTGDGLIGRHTDGVLLMGVDKGYLALQGGGGTQAVTHQGQYPLACRGQPDAAAAPQQDGEANILFQAVHHVGQSGLRIAQHLGGACEAAQLHRRQQGFQFFGIHDASCLYDTIS